MSKVLSSFSFGKYRVLKISTMPTNPYSHIRIDGKMYKPIPIYDMPQCVAIESYKDFTNQYIDFV